MAQKRDTVNQTRKRADLYVRANDTERANVYARTNFGARID